MSYYNLPMTVLLHGDDLTSLQNKLFQLKNESGDFDAIELEGEKLTKAQIEDTTRSQSLFQIPTLVIINSLTKNKLWDILLGQFKDSAHKLVFIEQKKLTSNQLSKFENTFSKIQILEFKQNPLIFSFTKELLPNNSKKLFPIWQELIKIEVVEVVFSMIVRQFRLLLLVKNGDTTMPSWQTKNLQSQAAHFTQEKLEDTYEQLLDIDFKNKTGQNILSLSECLELFLLNL